jgi:DNA polymerase-1
VIKDEEVTLLIDADIIAFTAASAVQKIAEDEFGFVQPFARRQEGEAVVDNMLGNLQIMFKATHFKLVLTDPKENWRRAILPSYKAFRKETPKPLLLEILKDYMRDKYLAFHWDSLEADDVLGILMTEPQGYVGRRILVGKDKDFLTIPGDYHRMGDLDAAGKPRIKTTSKWETIRYHLGQTLSGDATDGYPGCPGLGKARVPELLDNPVLLVPQPGVITRGVNKGNSVTKWVAEPTRDLWAMVVSHYKKAGLGEQDALDNARCAHILHDEDYDRDQKAIRLWTPEKLKGAYDDE